MILRAYLDPSFYLASRVHPLHSFSSTKVQAFIKRDDELSFGISGSKYRKYSSLIPYLKKIGIKTAFLIGSAYSNHILGLTQLLIENGITPKLYLYEPHTLEIKGNLFFLNLLIPLQEMVFFKRSEHALILETLNLLEKKVENSLFIPEGGDCEFSLPGAMTLGFDILEQKQQFDHVFVDAGSGLSAIGLLLSFKIRDCSSLVHVVSMEVEEEEFQAKLLHYKSYLEKLIKTPLSMPFYKFYKPKHLKSFGSTSSALFAFIQNFARSEGVFLDPIYSGKLFLEAKNILDEQSLEGSLLIIHSGGALTLSGFQNKLS